MRAVRRASRAYAVVAIPFLVVALLAAYAVNSALGGYLERSLYVPACANTCEKHGGHAEGHRVGGKSERGALFCQCVENERTTRQADLEGRSTFDRALHGGGKTVIMLLTFGTIGFTGVWLGARRRAFKQLMDGSKAAE